VAGIVGGNADEGNRLSGTGNEVVAAASAGDGERNGGLFCAVLAEGIGVGEAVEVVGRSGVAILGAGPADGATEENGGGHGGEEKGTAEDCGGGVGRARVVGDLLHEHSPVGESSFRIIRRYVSLRLICGELGGAVGLVDGRPADQPGPPSPKAVPVGGC
jgi:hypothetical protein